MEEDRTMALLIFDPALAELYQVKAMCDKKGIYDEIKEKLTGVISLIETRDAYCKSITSAPSDALATLLADTYCYPFEDAFNAGKTKWNLHPRMMTGHYEGQFLQTLVSMSKAKTILEIGMFTGYAALACAEVIPEDGTVTTLEFDPFLEDVAKSFFAKSPHGKKISIRIGAAQDTLLKLVEEKAVYDIVFIDANKDGYINYFKTVFEKGLLAKGGTIIFDNALIRGYAYTMNSTNKIGLDIRECNEYLNSRDDIARLNHEDKGCILVPIGSAVGVLVPIRDGILIVRRKEDVFL